MLVLFTYSWLLCVTLNCILYHFPKLCISYAANRLGWKSFAVFADQLVV